MSCCERQQDARKLDLYGKEDLSKRVVHAVVHEELGVVEAAKIQRIIREKTPDQ